MVESTVTLHPNLNCVYYIKLLIVVNNLIANVKDIRSTVCLKKEKKRYLGPSAVTNAYVPVKSQNFGLFEKTN